MPQLDISTFFSQAFWFFIFFSSLFLVVSCVFLPKLDKIINNRNKEVLDSFNVSFHLLKLAEKQIAEYYLALGKARAEAKIIIDNAFAQVEEAEANVKNILEEEDRKMNKFIEEKVENFKFEYIDELKEMATGIALSYYTKLTNSEIDEKFLVDLVSEEF